jgi:leucyl aminopeptidase
MMKIQVKKEGITHAKTDAILLLFCEGNEPWGDTARRIDEECRGLIRAFMESGDFEGKLYQTAVVFPQGLVGAKRIVLAGLGKKEEFGLEKLRGVFAKAAQCIRTLKLKSFATSLDRDLVPFSPGEAAEAAIEGVLLGLYQFTTFKTVDRDKIRTIDAFTLYEEDPKSYREISAAVKTAEIICGAVYFARDLVSMPANRMTPTDLAREASQIGLRHKTLACRVLDHKEMKKLGMNALLGVASGSEQPPKFIILEYHGAKKSEPPIVLVGKGITFDSGGISLKPAEKMDEMKSDMAGAAAVLGAIRAIADMKIPLNVVGLVPATENLPSGKAYKPGDILTALSGKTIEILNTDAEGRVILADALSYADRLKPAAILDIATLTGACVVALGDLVTGMMGTDDTLKDRVQKSAEKTGEKVWELPLWEEYHDLIKSDVADFKNTGGRSAGTITAAAFLSKFAGDHPWVHLDIAGPSWLTKERPYIPKGASGVGVRLFVDLLRHWR